MICLTLDCPVFSNFVASRQCMYEKLEKQSLSSFWDRPRWLLVRHLFSNSEMLVLLSHVNVVDVEHHVLPQLSAQQEFVKSWAKSALNCT